MAAAVTRSQPATWQELLERMRAAPDRFAYGHTGIGSIGHLMGERLMAAVPGLRVTPAAYRGSVNTTVDLLSGRVQPTFESVPAVMAHNREGSLRVVAVSTPERAPQLPDVPTFAELWHRDISFSA